MVIKGNEEAQKERERERDMKTTNWNVPSM